ncbi:MAG: hypothetical protein AAFU85_14835 [Planctomycetota bacterium]
MRFCLASLTILLGAVGAGAVGPSDSRSELTGELTSGEYDVEQSWSQERNFRRPYFVNVPRSQGLAKKLPVLVFLHGNGGNAKNAMRGWLRNRKQITSQFITVFAQGYRESWNIVSERSKANDLEFIESIVRDIARYDNVDANGFTVMGSSNGAALVNQLAIESRLPQIRNYISGVSPLNVWQHDGKQFKAKGDDNNYRNAILPMSGKRLLNISGTEDRLVPYNGGPSRAIPAKDGKLAFVSAERSTYLWAQVMGFPGKQLASPTRREGKVEFFSYLDGDVVHCKVNGAGHGATHEISEQILLNFLQGKRSDPRPVKELDAKPNDRQSKTDGFPDSAFQYAEMVEPDLAIPLRIDLDKAIEIPLYVDGVQTWGNLGRIPTTPPISARTLSLDQGCNVTKAEPLTGDLSTTCSGLPLPATPAAITVASSDRFR